MPHSAPHGKTNGQDGTSPEPFFTVAIPTFKRHDLLREALDSILSQGFRDVEVIVGNDDPDESLTHELLGTDDPRIRIVNHRRNLREVGNMNALLATATGRYFTWLYDDDLFEPDYLQTGHDILEQADYPDALFPSYRLVHSAIRPTPLDLPQATPTEYTGREFVFRYSATRPDVISTTGFIRLDSMRSTVGEFQSLSETVTGLYSEYLMLVRCGLLDRIVFINSPFVVFRAHSGSWGGEQHGTGKISGNG